jgi:hypothetical protein
MATLKARLDLRISGKIPMDSILLPIHVSGEIINGELVFKTSTDISSYPCDLFVANDLIIYISQLT